MTITSYLALSSFSATVNNQAWLFFLFLSCTGEKKRNSLLKTLTCHWETGEDLGLYIIIYFPCNVYSRRPYKILKTSLEGHLQNVLTLHKVTYNIWEPIVWRRGRVQLPSGEFIILPCGNMPPKSTLVKLMPHCCSTAGTERSWAPGALPDGCEKLKMRSWVCSLKDFHLIANVRIKTSSINWNSSLSFLETLCLKRLTFMT